MHVLIKINEANSIQYVKAINQREVGKMPVQRADDIIRAELAAVDFFGDIEYEEGDAEITDLIGVWATSQERWELWKAS